MASNPDVYHIITRVGEGWLSEGVSAAGTFLLKVFNVTPHQPAVK
jgi:hypothetical protein